MPRLPATVKSVELTVASRRKASSLYGGSRLRYYTFEFRYVFAAALHYLHARDASGCHRQASRANSESCLPFNLTARFPLTRKYVESRSRTRVTCTVSSQRGENNVIIVRLLPSDEKYHHGLMFYDTAGMQIRCFTLQCLKVSSSRMELVHAREQLSEWWRLATAGHIFISNLTKTGISPPSATLPFRLWRFANFTVSSCGAVNTQKCSSSSTRVNAPRGCIARTNISSFLSCRIASFSIDELLQLLARLFRRRQRNPEGKRRWYTLFPSFSLFACVSSRHLIPSFCLRARAETKQTTRS